MGTSARRAHSTRGNRSRSVKVSSAVRRRPVRHETPDLHDIMAHLAEAIAFARVSQRSLHQLEIAIAERRYIRLDALLSRPRRSHRLTDVLP